MASRVLAEGGARPEPRTFVGKAIRRVMEGAPVPQSVLEASRRRFAGQPWSTGTWVDKVDRW